MKIQKYLHWIKEYAEFIIYGVVLLALMVWQAFIYCQSIRVYQDLVIAAYTLQILNIILCIATAKRMRLLAQLLILTAILFGAIIIYYIEVLVVNVI